jgi:hypothetical protein
MKNEDITDLTLSQLKKMSRKGILHKHMLLDMDYMLSYIGDQYPTSPEKALQNIFKEMINENYPELIGEVKWWPIGTYPKNFQRAIKVDVRCDVSKLIKYLKK